MHRKPTIRDIAREAGVSDTAVSLSFQRNSRVSAATRERILAVARRLNYFPNRSARNLRYGDSRTIGFVVIEITNPFYARMIRSAERIAHGLGYEILFAESYWDPQKEIRIVSNMIENRVAGILMCFCEKTRRKSQPDPTKPSAVDRGGHLSPALQGLLRDQRPCQRGPHGRRAPAGSGLQAPDILQRQRSP